MRFLSLLTIVIVAAVSCTETGGIDPSGAEVVIDGTVFVAVTTTPSPIASATKVVENTPQIDLFSWNRVDGEFIGDVLPQPAVSRFEIQGNAFLNGSALTNLKDVAFWDGNGPAVWTISGHSSPRLLLADKATLRNQEHIRFTMSVGDGEFAYTWPTGEPWVFVTPGVEDVRVTINASPSTFWSVSITTIGE